MEGLREANHPNRIKPPTTIRPVFLRFEDF
jgi:hypothetical protein